MIRIKKFVPNSAACLLLRVLLDWMMSWGSVPFQNCLAEHLPVKYRLSAEVKKKKEKRQLKDKTDIFACCAAAVCLCICPRWPVLSESRLRVGIVLVQRPALPRAEPPCDLRLRGVTGRSSPYCLTCDRRCGWPTPGGWLKAGEQWPWGERRGGIDLFTAFCGCCWWEAFFFLKDRPQHVSYVEKALDNLI